MAFLDFVERWVCCGVIDDASVLDDIAMLRTNPDTLAEAYVAYTHDPEERHVTDGPDCVFNVDNGAETVNVVKGMVFNEIVEEGIVALLGVASVPDDEESTTVEPVDAKVEPVPEMGANSSPEFVLADNELAAIMETVPGPPVPSAKVGGPSPVNAEEQKGPSSVYRVCHDVIEVPRHRRLPHHVKGHYAASIVSEIKNRLGCPAATAANKLAVRRMAINAMDKHGLRPSHVRSVIEIIVAGVFIPDEEDLRGAKIEQSNAAGELRQGVANAGPVGAWGDLYQSFRHPFKNRGAQRVRGAV